MISMHSALSTSLPVVFRTWLWWYTCLLFYNFDALVQTSDIRIERRQVVFPCRMQDSNPRSLTPIRQQTECLLTNRLSYRESSQKTWIWHPIPMIRKHSALSTSLPVCFRTWLWRYTCLLFLISMLWQRQAIFESKGDKLSSSAECRIRTQGLRHLFASRLNACWQTDWAIEDQAKTWTQQPVPMISKHSAHSTSLSVDFRTWLWRYSCLLLLISIPWHRQAIFEWKGVKLSSSAECRIRTQGLRHLFASRLNACWQTDWAIEDQAKTWTQQPVPMISKHSAHSTSLPDGFRTWLWRYTCFLLLISMLWHRQAILASPGEKLSSFAECMIRTQGLRHLFASRLIACRQTDWASENQAKNMNSTARPYDQQAFSLLDLTARWLSHLALATYMFVVVDFDALAQASDTQIERRQVALLCWMQDSNPRSLTQIHQQTECLLTNWLSYRGSSSNFDSTARPYDQQAFSPLDLTAKWISHLALAKYTFVVVNFDALAQASDIRIERRQVVFLCWMQDSNTRSQTPIRQQTESLPTNRLSYRESS